MFYRRRAELTFITRLKDGKELPNGKELQKNSPFPHLYTNKSGLPRGICLTITVIRFRGRMAQYYLREGSGHG